jgi:hypothetical protein
VVFVIAIPELGVMVATVSVDCTPWARPAVGLNADAERVSVVIVVAVVAPRESSSDAASEAALNALPCVGDIPEVDEGIVRETDALTVESRAANSRPFPVALENTELRTS